MKKYLDHAIIPLNKDSYLIVIVILASLLNFLSGVNIDIYSPSMPSIASYFHASIIVTKNTITLTLIGWVIGALFWGVLIDNIGRKKILVLGILFYVVTSLFSPWCHRIHQLMIIRFIQGFMVSSTSIGCRALIADNVSDHRYNTAMLYASLGYALGPILGPFIGGILQYTFGWQANFIALGFGGSVLLLMLVVFVKESIPQRQSLRLHAVIKNSFAVLRHKKFMTGVIIAGLIQMQIMLYPTFGSFIVEKILHHSVLVYGNTALVMGSGYLMGTLINGVLLKIILPKQICYIACIVLLVGLILSYLFAIVWSINLFTIMLPLILFCVSAGLMFSNVIGTNIKQFPKNVGVATAIQASLMLLIAAVGIFIISHIHIVGLFQLAIIFSVLSLLEMSIFFFSYRSLLG